MNANETYIHVAFKQNDSPADQFIQMSNPFFNFMIGFSLINQFIQNFNFLLSWHVKTTEAFMNIM